MIALFSKALTGIWGYVAAGALAFALGFGGAWKIKDGIEAEAQVASDNAAVKSANATAAAVQNEAKRAMAHQAEADAITEGVDLSAVQAQTKIITNTVTLTREVPVYVTPQTDNRFPLPCGFIRLHDAAAAGADLAADPAAFPNPAGKSDADACEIAASQAAGIIAANYGLARQWLNEVTAWRQWYTEQSGAWGKP